ncbi:MAG: sulfatase-like hydrolase/transferase [Acidobacteria bacterium]|nr:sulfatase-like hydrolase/transferase [Acidobacteriota bacterium]
MTNSSSAWTRRGFAATLGAGALARAAAESRPNILWITCEDTGQQIGAYGDRYAVTPNLDRLAARGVRYRNAWSNAPVCAPARTTIISGLYPPSTGAEHMRSMTRLPEGMRMYPCYLREAGYYATNNAKEDYNLEHTGQVWDDSSGKAHWRNRKPGQPFFSIFNLTVTHESQIPKRPHTLVHDPARVRVPAYHPDTPEVRHDWAQYYDNITTMDGQAGGILRQLEQDGLAENTIVFFYGGHGPGMPRCKRYPYDSGLRVPMIVHLPEKYRHLAAPDCRPGGVSERMVGFIDLAPTVLSLAGIRPPEHMQGGAFLGRHIAPERSYNYGFRGRMDERYDMMRSVCDRRYVYIRNYLPHEIYGQHVNTMFQMPTTQVWKKLFDEGKLNAAQRRFWEPKPPEELYDLDHDRDEVNNLAGSSQHKETLERLRKAQQDLALKIRDVGFLPEGEIHSRSKGSTPYQVGHDDSRYPLKRIMGMADLTATPALLKGLSDPDSAVRYWAVMGIQMRGAAAVMANRQALYQALDDSAPYVRIAAAEALGRHGDESDVRKALAALVDVAPAGKNGAYVCLRALNAIDSLGAKARPAAEAIRAIPVGDPTTAKRAQEYPARVMAKLKAAL